MFATLACLSLFSNEPLFVNPKIIAATAFRNGYGFVLKEIEVPASGEVMIKDLDSPVNGTLWFAPSSGVRVTGVTMTYIDDEPQLTDVGTIDDMLFLNVGKDVEVGIWRPGQQEMTTLAGRLRAMSEVALTLEIGSKLHMIPRHWVQTVAIDTGTAKTKHETTVRTPVVRVRTNGSRAGKLYTIGLLHGLSWSPSYHVDISDPKKVMLTMKATVINNVGDFSGIDLGMVSGFPEVGQLGHDDPLTQGVERIFTLAQQYSRPPSAFPSGGTTGGTTGGFSGGFGGGGGMPGAGFVPSGISRVAYDPTDNSLIVQGADKAIRDLEQQVAASQHTDLFVYTAANVSMKRTDRSYIVIQESEADYAYRYVAETGTTTSETTVVKSLVFTNRTQLPWTDAPAMIVHKEQLVGQSLMPYTVVGDEAEVRIGRATTVNVSALTQEIAREQRARTVYNTTYDLVTMKDTVTVTNFDKEAVTVRVRRTVNGRVTTSSDNGQWSQSPVPSDLLNTVGNGQWEVTLRPGEKRDLTVEYTRYVRV